MNEAYVAKHTENASDLYELRHSWQSDTEIRAPAFASVEARLNAGIFLIATTLQSLAAESAFAGEEAQKEPSTEGECFVFLAGHLNSQKPDRNSAGYALAYEWLTLDPAKSSAAETALSLYPETDASQLHTLYETQEPLRPTLMRLFRKQMQTLPIDLINTAASPENAPPALQLEALNYAAANPDIGLDLFRSHYAPLRSGRTQWDASIVATALWGGLVRGDAEASIALTAAIAQTSSPQDLFPLLRLAALSGRPDFLPLLLQAAESMPDSGYPLLVLYGQKSVIPALINAMEAAHTIEQAAAAFEQLTDYALPLTPRLTVAGEAPKDKETDNKDTAEPAPDTLIPDSRAAHTWWQQNQSTWKTGERWLAGKPATPAVLLEMTKKHAGQFGCDLMALLALSQKAPLNIPSEIWRSRQQHLLATPTPTPGKPTPGKPNPGKPNLVKPTSTRHA